MKKPIISFIVPVYNCEKYLVQCLNSIIFQDDHCFEIIIINDGSTDKSLDIITYFSNKYDCIRFVTTENRGVSAARNRGIEESSGAYLAFLDADDVLCKNAITPKLIEIISLEKPDLVGMEYFQSTSKLKKGKKFGLSSSGKVLKGSEKYSINMRNHFCAYLYKSSLIKKIHMCFPEEVKIAEDRVFLYHYSFLAENVYLYNNPWFIYRIHRESVMNTKTGFSYLIEGNIKAWAWLKDRGDEQLQLSCDSEIFLCMAEYIELSAKRGTSLKEIEDRVSGCNEFERTLQNYDQFWKTGHNIEVFESFCKSPYDFYKSKRKERAIYRIIKPIISNHIVKEMYLTLQYKTDLTEYISHI